MGKNSLNAEEQQDPRRAISQGKLIERSFGWTRQIGLPRQVKLRRLDRVDWLSRLTMVAYDMVRMRKLIPIHAPVI
jgi:hypothetical protein